MKILRLLCVACLLHAGIGVHAQLLSIDPDFGFNGFTRIDFTGNNNNDEPTQLVATADGFIAGGATIVENFDYRTAVASLTSSGKVNPAFGNGTGKILAKFNTRSEGMGFLVQSDGRIVGVGRDNESNAGSSQKPFIFRLLATGEVDTSFADSGYVRQRYDPTSGGAHFGAVEQLDGKIVAFGHSYGNINGGSSGFGAMRFLQDGNLDATYSGDGMTRITAATAAALGSGFLQPDGKVVIAGAVWNGSANVIALVRFDSTGAPDVTFGDQGLAVSAIPTRDGKVQAHLLANGKIIVTYTHPLPQSFAAARFKSDGSTDQTFAAQGVSILSTLVNSSANASKVDANGNLIIAGQVVGDAMVAKLNPEGQLDTTFGTLGAQTIILGTGGTGYLVSIALQGDAIVGLGYDFGSRGGDFVLVRLAEATGAVENIERLNSQIYPNPTAHSLTTRLKISTALDVRAQLIDIIGNVVATSPYGQMDSGIHELTMDVSQIPAGTYLLSVRAGADHFTNRVIIAK